MFLVKIASQGTSSMMHKYANAIYSIVTQASTHLKLQLSSLLPIVTLWLNNSLQDYHLPIGSQLCSKSALKSLKVMSKDQHA